MVEFKEYCTKQVLKSRILGVLVFLLFVLTVYFATVQKPCISTGDRYLLFTMLKYNYTPETYPKTFLSWELENPLVNKEQLIREVQQNRLYSYFRPFKARKIDNGVWVVVGFRETFTDTPKFQVLRKGTFVVQVKNVGGKFFVAKESWRGG